MKKYLVTTILLITQFFLSLKFYTNQVLANGVRDFQQVDDNVLDQINPLKIGNSPIAEDLSTPGGILSQVLTFAFPIAGLILFIMIVWGGFEILSQSATKKSTEAGRQRITSAIIGFGLLFASFWIIQIIEQVFGITIFL